MAFALLLTIVLAVILLGGAIIIGKSSLPAQEKFTSLLVILALFALVSIVNEVKRASVGKSKQTVIRTVDFSKGFFNAPILSHRTDSDLPYIDDSRDFVTRSLGDWDPSKSENYQLSFLYSDQKQESTRAFKEYTRLLQEEGIPAIYLELGYPDFGILDLTTALKIPSVESLNEAVKKYNQEGKVPNIFIDNAQNAFTYDETSGNGFVCTVCKYLVSLYESNKLNIVLISNDANAREYFRSDPIYSSRFNFFTIRSKSKEELESYLSNRVNLQIHDEEKRFSPANVEIFYNVFGANLELVEEYLQNIRNYKNVNDFVNSKLESQINRVSGFRDLSDFLNPFISVSESAGGNSWVSYSQIRKIYDGNPTKKLDDAINAHLLMKENNSYRFLNETLYYAFHLSKEGKRSKPFF